MTGELLPPMAYMVMDYIAVADMVMAYIVMAFVAVASMANAIIVVIFVVMALIPGVNSRGHGD